MTIPTWVFVLMLAGDILFILSGISLKIRIGESEAPEQERITCPECHGVGKTHLVLMDTWVLCSLCEGRRTIVRPRYTPPTPLMMKDVIDGYEDDRKQY